MKKALQDVRVILFDMDGTLYQDHTFHRDYLRYLLDGTEREAFTEEAIRLADEIMTHGVVPMDRFYRVQPTSRAGTWKQLAEYLRGCMIDEMPFEMCYRDGLGELRFLADPWEVATMIAAALGTLEQNGEEAFLRVRKEMEDNALAPDPELRGVLEALKERYITVLLSNSPQQSAANFIDRLDFTGAFTFIAYDACKPYQLFESLHSCPGLEDVSDQTILSVGDHAFNEIVNVHLAGGKTIWMDPYNAQAEIPCTFRVKNIPQLMALLRGQLL